VFLGVPGGGKRIVNTGATVQEFDEDGKIVSGHAYWDAALFLRQAGALSTTAATVAAV
jgi:ketosteroid isomerase-like protein